MNDVAKDFCVYVHSRRDNGLPFYVGKGRRNRPHEASGRSQKWCDLVLDAGGFDVEIVAKGLPDSAAKALEANLISRMDGLVNVSPRDNRPDVTTLAPVVKQITPPPDLLADLDAWIAQQPVPPSRSAVIVAALRQFLAGQNGPMKEGDPTPPDAEGC